MSPYYSTVVTYQEYREWRRHSVAQRGGSRLGPSRSATALIPKWRLSGLDRNCVTALLESGADPNLFGSKKCSPLMTCILNNDVAGTLTLLQHGASLDQSVDGGSTSGGTKRPIHGAIVNNYVSIIHLLICVDCDVNMLRSLLRDGVIFYFVNDADILLALRITSAAPPPLQSLCRRAVRGRLPMPVMASISALPVPAAIKDYLAMRDVEKIVAAGLIGSQPSS